MRILAAVLLVTAVAAAGEVAVRVTKQGRPVEGAAVAALKPDETPVFDRAAWKPAATTDAGGIAVLDCPPGGRVLVFREGSALAVARAAGGPVDVELRDAWPFAGRVVDAADEPVAGAAVYLRAKHRTGTFRTATDRDGSFRFGAPWLDDYALRIEAPGFLPEERGPLTEEASGRTYALARPAALVVTVTDGDGEALADWPLRAGGRRGRTDEEGRARIGGLRPGEATLRAEAPFRLARSRSFRLADGAEVAVAARGVPPAWVRARLASRGGDALEEVRATLNGQALEPGDDGVRAGRVRAHDEGELEAEAAGHLPATFSFRAPGPGRVLDLGELVLDPRPAGDVIVRAPDGAPPPSGRAVPLAGEAVAFEKGRVRLPVGDWTLRVDGYPPAHAEVVAPGPVHVTLPRPHFLKGRVIDHEEQPVANATVTCSRLTETTDPEGRFRIGPVADRRVALQARHGTARTILALRPGPGEVVLRLPRQEFATLRGRVLAGGRPVHRFAVNGEPVLDSDGRFEVVVDRARRRPVVLELESLDRSYPFALPPPGEELVARIPGGAVHVHAPPGTGVTLVRPGPSTADHGETGGDGVVRFAHLAPGQYGLLADGYHVARCTVVEGDPAIVRLEPKPAAPTGRVRIRRPDGDEVAFEHAEGLWKIGDGVVRFVAGEERVFDWLERPGLLELDGGRRYVELERDWPDARLRWVVYGKELRLGAGTYLLRAGAVRRTVTVRENERTIVRVRGGALVRGSVIDGQGDPVAGAAVTLRVPGAAQAAGMAEPLSLKTNPAGRVDLGRYPAGRYEAVATREGFAPAVSTVVVTDGAVVEDGFPLVLRRSARARVRVLDPAGAPIAGVLLEAAAFRVWTDRLGAAELPEDPASVSIAVPGYARIRGREVRDGDVVRLEVGADLLVLGGPARERMTLTIDGEEWAWGPRPLERAGRLERADLPPGDAELTVAPEPESEDPARVFRFRLRPGQRTTVDLDR